MDSRESGQWDSLSCQIGYRFRRAELLKKAMTHRSVCQKKDKQKLSNERLEFLGDAVLGLIVTDELFQRFPEDNEGQLTKAKSLIVSRDVLARQAKKIGLGQFLLLSNGEEKSGGRSRQSILADAFEAVIGAIYLDGGMEAVRPFIRRHLLNEINFLLGSRFHNNYKSWLLEHVQSEGEANLRYRVVFEKGPDHRKEFTVEVTLDGKGLGRGKGSNKKKAEQEAACQALKRLGVIQKNQEKHARRK